MNETRRNTAIVGFSSILMIIFIAGLLVWKSGIMLKVTGYKVVGEFQNIEGLLPGSEVRYRGLRVGTVGEIEPSPKYIHVNFLVDSDIKIPEGSMLRIVFDGLVGERYISIIPNPKAIKNIKPGAVLTGISSAGLADFVDMGTQNLEETKAILQSVRSVITDKKVLGSIESAIFNFDKITKDLGGSIEDFGKFTKSNQIGTTLTEISNAANAINQATHRVALDGDIAQNLSQSSQDLAQTSKNLNKITSALAEDQSIDDMKTILSNFADISRQINGFLKDQKIKESVMRTLKKSEDMFTQSGSILGKLSEVKVKSEASVQYYSYPNDIKYEIKSDIGTQRAFLRIGIGDRAGTSQLVHLQQGIAITPKLNGRVGLINTQPGIGLDYTPIPKVQLTSDLYDVHKASLDLSGRYAVFEQMDVILGANNILETTRGYSVGFAVH